MNEHDGTIIDETALSLRILDKLSEQTEALIDDNARLKLLLRIAEERVKDAERVSVSDLTTTAWSQAGEEITLLLQRLKAAERRADKADQIIIAWIKELQSSTEDGLTKLPNQSSFLGKLEYLHGASERQGGYSLAFFDLIGFKTVNDFIGHNAGNAVLEEIGEIIRKTVPRKSDLKGRYGGDEFVIAFNGVNDIEKVASLAQDVLTAIEDSAVIKNIISTAYETEQNPARKEILKDLKVSASVGIRVHHKNSMQSHEDVVAQADSTMYIAKRAVKRGEENFICITDGTTFYAYANGKIGPLPPAVLKAEHITAKALNHG